MKKNSNKVWKSQGEGSYTQKDFLKIGKHVIIEVGVRVFHPENIEIGDDVYIGHDTCLKGYYKNRMVIGSDSWIGQKCFFHSAGGIIIGKQVGIGPGVYILTSTHAEEGVETPILNGELVFEEVVIEEGCDIGMGAVILPNVRIGRGSIVGAGSVVSKDVAPYSVVAGNPAKMIRERK